MTDPIKLSRRAALAGGAALALTLRAPIAAAEAAVIDIPSPGPQDTCPVCGMFVAKYPEWIATIEYEDGRVLHFDGAKDYFKFLLEPDKYLPGYADAPIKAMGVTEYYGLKRIAAQDAIYVTGSDVLGPMGHELVPLATEADTEDYFRDHKGRHRLAHQDVTFDMLLNLDDGQFE